MKKLLLPLVLALATGLAAAADRPYNPDADAKAEIRAALTQAAATRQPVLLIFGANWCPDCRALDQSLKTGRNAELIAKDFKVVKVDVGHFDHNVDVTTAYGNATGHGIPSAIIVSPDNRILFATRAGELANAREMSDDGVYEFFTKAVSESAAAAK